MSARRRKEGLAMLKQIKRDEMRDTLSLGKESLSCGTCLRVLVPNEDGGAQLVETRLEISDMWYFVGMPDVDVVGCFAEIAP